MEDKKYDLLAGFLRSFRLKHTREDGESGLSLLDRLTPDGDESVTRGNEEIDLLVDDLVCDYLEPLHNRIIELESKRQDAVKLLREANQYINDNTPFDEEENLMNRLEAFLSKTTKP